LAAVRYRNMRTCAQDPRLQTDHTALAWIALAFAERGDDLLGRFKSDLLHA